MNSTTETRSTTALKSTGLQISVRTLDVAFDVGSLTLNWSVELGGKMINGECANDSRDIRKTLGRIMNEASQQDYLVQGIRILCESTGAALRSPHQNRQMRIAR